MERLSKKDIYNYMQYALYFNKYDEIMNLYKKVDVSKDKNFQKSYNGLYKLRQRSEEWYNGYYSVFEKYKNDKNISFSEILSNIEKKTGTVVPSFASKMLHTINPKYPIFDANIRKVLGLGNVKGKTNDEKMTSACEIYNSLCEEYKNLQYLVRLFDEIFPDVKMSDTKKIDTVLFWKGSAG